MLEHYLRPRLEPFLFRPIANVLSRTKISPTAVTLFSLVCGLSIMPLYRFPFIAITLLWLSGLGDVVDGALARSTNRMTMRGTIFDIVSDRVVEFAVVLALFFVDPERALVCLMMLGSILICVTSFLVAGIMIEKQGPKSFYYSPGLMERAEAFIFFTFMFIFPEQFHVLGWMFTSLVLLTACIRIIQTALLFNSIQRPQEFTEKN